MRANLAHSVAQNYRVTAPHASAVQGGYSFRNMLGNSGILHGRLTKRLYFLRVVVWRFIGKAAVCELK